MGRYKFERVSGIGESDWGTFEVGWSMVLEMSGVRFLPRGLRGNMGTKGGFDWGGFGLTWTRFLINMGIWAWVDQVS